MVFQKKYLRSVFHEHDWALKITGDDTLCRQEYEILFSLLKDLLFPRFSS